MAFTGEEKRERGIVTLDVEVADIHPLQRIPLQRGSK